MRRIDPIFKGMAGASASVFLIACLGSALYKDLEPSPELLRVMAGIGGSFFLAYIIEATWLAQRFPKSKRAEVFIGVLMGLAAAGLLGVISALVLSERPASDAFGRGEDVYFWWSAVSLGGLGLLVALQPGIVHSWLHENEKKPSDYSDE